MIWAQIALVALLIYVLVAIGETRERVNKVADQVDRMHAHLIQLMYKQGVDPLKGD